MEANDDKGKVIAKKRIEWSRSFFLALKSIIIGSLFALVWIALYLFCLYVFEISPYLGSYPSNDEYVLVSLVEAGLSLVSPTLVIRAGVGRSTGIIRMPIIESIVGMFGLDWTPGGALTHSLLLNFMFLVFIIPVNCSFCFPIVKYSLREVGCKISWLRAFLVAMKSALVAFFLTTIFMLLAFLMIFVPALGIVGFVILLVLAEVSLYASLVKFTSKEAKASGTDWIRSFVIAFKAILVSLLWVVLMIFATVAISGIIMTFAIGSLSPSIVGIGIVTALVIVLLVSILTEIAPAACVIKYLSEEIAELQRTGDIPPLSIEKTGFSRKRSAPVALCFLQQIAPENTQIIAMSGEVKNLVIFSRRKKHSAV